jgi:hypothetical protein
MSSNQTPCNFCLSLISWHKDQSKSFTEGAKPDDWYEQARSSLNWHQNNASFKLSTASCPVCDMVSTLFFHNRFSQDPPKDDSEYTVYAEMATRGLTYGGQQRTFTERPWIPSWKGWHRSSMDGLRRRFTFPDHCGLFIFFEVMLIQIGKQII